MEILNMTEAMFRHRASTTMASLWKSIAAIAETSATMGAPELVTEKNIEAVSSICWSLKSVMEDAVRGKETDQPKEVEDVG